MHLASGEYIGGYILQRGPLEPVETRDPIRQKTYNGSIHKQFSTMISSDVSGGIVLHKI